MALTVTFSAYVHLGHHFEQVTFLQKCQELNYFVSETLYTYFKFYWAVLTAADNFFNDGDDHGRSYHKKVKSGNRFETEICQIYLKN